MSYRPICVSFLTICIWSLCVSSKTLNAQISDSLYNHLISEAIPKDRNHISNWEYADILHATDYNDILLFAAEYELIKKQCIDRINDSHTTKDDKIRLYAGVACYAKKAYTNEKNLESIAFYQNVIVLANKDTNHYKDLLEAYNSIITIHIDNYNMDSAIVLLDDLNTIIKDEDSTSLSKLYSVYSYLYEKVKQYETSNSYRKKALDYMKGYSKPGDSYFILVTRMVSNYVNLYKLNKKIAYRDSAQNYIQIIESETSPKAKKWLSFASYLKSKLVVLDSNYILALKYNYDFDSLENLYGGSGFYAYMNIFNNLSKYSNLIKLGKFEYIPKLEKLLENPFMLDQKASACKMLYEHFASKKQWDKAYTYLDMYQRTMDSMKIEDNRNKLFETTQKFKVAEQESIIKELENKSLRNSRMIILITGISLLLITLLIGTQVIYRLKAKRKQTEDDLKTEQLLNKLNQIELEKNEEKNKLLKLNEKAIYNQRKEISKHIHDGISNGLAALRFYIEDLKENSPDPNIYRVLTSLEEETNALYLQTRQFMHELQGGTRVASTDIIAFLETLQLKFSGTARIRIKLGIDHQVIQNKLSLDQQEQLFFVIKEAVINVIKHARASQIEIFLHSKSNMCVLQINDNGIGFRSPSKQGGMGIENIKSRVQMLEGHFEWKQNEQGTKLTIQIPLQDEN